MDKFYLRAGRKPGVYHVEGPHGSYGYIVLDDYDPNASTLAGAMEQGLRKVKWRCDTCCNERGEYLVRFTRFSSHVPIVQTIDGERRLNVLWEFEVQQGSKKGERLFGVCRYAVRRGRADGERELAVRSNMYRWMVACGVDFEYPPEFADPDNILPELEEIMQKAGTLLVVTVQDDGLVSQHPNSVQRASDG